MTESHETGRCAAVVYEKGAQVDALLLDFAREMRARGVRVGGVAQRSEDPDAPVCAQTIALTDLQSGERLDLMQDLGPGSESCRLDPAALAQAGALVRRAVEDGAQLVFIQRFGAQEAAGAGLREELAYAFASGRSVLTAIKAAYVADWLAFCGPQARLLDADAAALRAWWEEEAQGV